MQFESDSKDASSTTVAQNLSQQLSAMSFTCSNAGESHKTFPQHREHKLNDFRWGYSGMIEDEDWTLCDKDCGWCGHCADNMLC